MRLQNLKRVYTKVSRDCNFRALSILMVSQRYDDIITPIFSVMSSFNISTQLMRLRCQHHIETHYLVTQGRSTVHVWT